MINPGFPNLFWLVVLGLILTFPSGNGVEGIRFTFNGFNGLSDLYVVPNSPWTYYPNDSSIYLDPSNTDIFLSLAGRILYPELVQMKDPVNMTAKSFSCNFIFQIFIQDGNSGETGSGMAFIMVPDNFTLGANLDYMGLLTTKTSLTAENYLSDNHTFGVEFDTHMNPEFNDPNANHIGIDLTSMNSTGGSFIPTFTLATPNPNLYQQVWIDYFQSDSHMDIYITPYGQDKPATPFTSSALDLSFLNDYMYIGFSAAVGIESSNEHKILAWSFSTDGPASPIWIARDAPPAPSPPPPAPPPRRAPPPPPPASAPPPPRGPVPAPNPPQSPPVPAPSSPPPPIITAPSSNTSPSLSPASNPPPFNPPSPPSPDSILSPSPSNEPASPPKPKPVRLIIAIAFSILGGVVLMSLCWKIIQVTSHPIHFFLAHAAGGDKSGKNFPALLNKELKSTWRYKFNLIKVFFDRESLPMARDFPEEIQRELDKTQVGVVIITKEFFERKWPMTELLSFVDSNKKNPDRVRILPLFYRLKADDVKTRLRVGSWDANWREMSTEQHLVNVQECREAIETLCRQYGLEYNASNHGDDLRYIKEILKEVVKISDEMRKQS